MQLSQKWKSVVFLFGMSKAFTKEQDDQDDDSDLEASQPALPKGSKNYMTPAGAIRYREELKKLLNETRPAVTATVQWAASNGDRSENADYIYGKRRLREIDRRIRFLTKRLEAAEIVDPAHQTGDSVKFGATVIVRYESGTEKKISIVGVDEIDLKQGRISWVSPLGSVLLNAKVGDMVLLKSPRGEEELEVISIQYLPLE
jgi:transcription elongation factor GreB